mmetsp:Transcript_82836/g.224918  ORF Transcript_82836/g.224918 Transcript_82836/m.224918 type:complete len:142 (+) Transcript_82836:3-428(+)
MARRQLHSVETDAKLQQVESLIASRVRLRQIPMKMSFQDFDRARSGRVSRSQFLRIMSMVQCALTDQQVALLLDTYCEGVPEGRFAYTEFCESVEGYCCSDGGGEGTATYSVKTGRPPKYFDCTGELMPLRDEGWRRPVTR